MVPSATMVWSVGRSVDVVRWKVEQARTLARGRSTEGRDCLLRLHVDDWVSWSTRGEVWIYTWKTPYASKLFEDTQLSVSALKEPQSQETSFREA